MKFKWDIRAVAWAFLACWWVAAPAPAGEILRYPLKAAESRSTDITFSAADAPAGGSSIASAGTVREISAPEASFIKIRFDYIKLPLGVTLEVAGADRRETYRYGRRYANQESERHTVDPRQGEDGVTRYSAMSVSGNRVLLRLVGTAQEPWTREHYVRITFYLQGYSAAKLDEMQKQDARIRPLSVCGGDDKLPAVCYAGSDPVAHQRSRPVARMVTPVGYCTAWRAGPGNRLFTNHHCAATAADISASEFWFNYQSETCEGTSEAAVVKVPGDQLLKVDEGLDFALFSVKNFEAIESFGYFGLDPRPAILNEEIFVPGHPGGRMKEIAVVSDQDGGGRCRVNDPVTDGLGSNLDLGYHCDTEGGSSGSPVVARSSRRVLALHHLGGCMNEASRMELIWPKVSSFFNGQVPAGDGGTGGGNVAPTADFDVSVSGYTASFTDRSSDADGSIVTRRWEFGDGAASSLTHPTRAYAAANRYTVRLTVTDNQGATSSATQTVSVAMDTMLANDVPVAGIGGVGGTARYWTMQVPEGTSQLQFAMAGGSGDADLYVRHAGQPSLSAFHCRPYQPGNNESCVFLNPPAGVWHVMVRGYYGFSGITLVGRHTAASAATRTYANETDLAVYDYSSSYSGVSVTGRSGYASSNSKVSVNIPHSYVGDLYVDLIAPDGTSYVLHRYGGGSYNGLAATYTVNLSNKLLNGVWRLRVYDGRGGDTGWIERWSITF